MNSFWGGEGSNHSCVFGRVLHRRIRTIRCLSLESRPIIQNGLCHCTQLMYPRKKPRMFNGSTLLCIYQQTDLLNSL